LCPRTRFAGDGVQDGGLCEWIAWPEKAVLPLPTGFTPADAAMLEPLGVALHAMDLGHVRPGDTVGVFGCGPIGLLMIQIARLGGGAGRAWAWSWPGAWGTSTGARSRWWRADAWTCDRW